MNCLHAATTAAMATGTTASAAAARGRSCSTPMLGPLSDNSPTPAPWLFERERHGQSHGWDQSDESVPPRTPVTLGAPPGALPIPDWDDEQDKPSAAPSPTAFSHSPSSSAAACSAATSPDLQVQLLRTDELGADDRAATPQATSAELPLSQQLHVRLGLGNSLGDASSVASSIAPVSVSKGSSKEHGEAEAWTTEQGPSFGEATPVESAEAPSTEAEWLERLRTQQQQLEQMDAAIAAAKTAREDEAIAHSIVDEAIEGVIAKLEAPAVLQAAWVDRPRQPLDRFAGPAAAPASSTSAATLQKAVQEVSDGFVHPEERREKASGVAMVVSMAEQEEPTRRVALKPSRAK